MEQFYLPLCHMHVRNDIARSDMTALLFSPRGACPGQGKEGAGLTLQSSSIIDVSLGAFCMLPGPLCCTWLKPSCSSRISNVLICFAMALLTLLLRHVTNLTFISTVSQQSEGTTFPPFCGLGSKEGKGELKDPQLRGQCNWACQRCFIFQRATMMFSVLQLSRVSVATVTAPDFRSDLRVSSQIPRIWGTLN